jgi:hypothetical protein
VRTLLGIDGLLRSAEARGYQMARVEVSLADIPSASVPALLDPESRPDNASALRVQSLAFVEARERAWACPSHGDERRPLCAACANAPRFIPVRAEGPIRGSAAHNAIRYELVDGIRDPSAAVKIVEARRTSIVAKEILPQLLYAFRYVDDQEPGLELVSFVLPPAIELQISRSRDTAPFDNVARSFSRATLPVRPGGSEAVVARVASSAAAAWIERLSPRGAPPPVEDLLVGIELSHAGDEPEPRIVAHVSRVRGEAVLR